MLLEIDGTIIVLIISFIVFVFIMQKILYSPLGNVRNERKRYIRNNKRYTSYNFAKKLQLIDKKQAEIIKARQEANEALNKETAGAHKKKTEVVTDALNNSKQKVIGFKNQLEIEKTQTKEVLKSEITQIASAISSKILGVYIPIEGITDETLENVLNR
ncbi:MAG: ATP synthase F0 subunit B [Candidatus Gastranaerophilaceae bacterium]|jgi:F-type H+-transporting ATPase subunit b